MMVPKLRFKEFTNKWCECLLGNLVDIKSGNSPSTYELSSEGNYPFVKVEDMNNCTKYQIDAREYVINSQFCFPAGSIIFPKRGAAIMNNKVRILNQNSCADTNMMALIATSIKPEFLYYLVNLIGLYKIADTSTIPQINNKHILSFKVDIPSEEEQTKIADFLSSVDEKITLLNQQYDLLCQYKKGMMQEIFSQKMRFKDDSGRAFPEWKSTTLDEVVDLITNGLALDQNDSKNGYPVSRIETISERCINMKKVGFVDTDNDISNYKLNYGDMLFSNINSISHIGKIAYFDIDDTLYHGMNLLRIVIKNSHCKLFFYYQLTTDTNKKYFESRANQAVSQASINQTELRKTPVQVPCKEEQTKIANFLSALDDKIVVKKAELDKLKTWKQGLLQQMFV
ncbi:restriction endonuclease subunit S [Raoultella planticola]|uniref:restriction endonuclease subunit S n=1 Tax=Raoultella planticola TaxID=575 RepID=UPI00292A789A|nr:restriction endonuclease subunit S [Raoultella planticola]MDV1191523.1 restriction endonuclease subunit S [Raoultella planticola]WPJ17575.1 restriction endonuclease subunit S [Raoultella planticola]